MWHNLAELSTWMWPHECGMMLDVENDAAEQARARVRAARRAAEDAETQAAKARQAYHQVLADEQKAKTLPQSELIDLSGYAREHLRRIARAAGVPPARG